MRLTILSDNSHHPTDDRLATEHGLAIFIEHEGQQILCDFGASELYARHAALLGIDLNALTFAFASHGHRDHTGGMGHFLAHHAAPIYLTPEVFAYRFYSSRGLSKHEISTDLTLQQHHPDRFRYVTASRWLDDAQRIALVKTDHAPHPTPLGNGSLTKATACCEVADDFSHELSAAFRTDKGLVIINSCSHRGALNIIDACCTFTGEPRLHAYIGGLHLIDSDKAAEETRYLSDQLTRQHPHATLLTGHCTGSIAKEILKQSSTFTQIIHVGLQIVL